MKRYFKLFILFFKHTLKREMAYRVDYMVWSLVTVGWFIFNIIFWHLLFANINSIAGWSKGRVFILQGFYFLLDFMIWGIYYGSLEYLPQQINRGELDHHLTKPINTQFYLSFNNFHLNQLTNLILGISTIIYGLRLDHLHPQITDIIYAAAIFLIGNLFIYGAYFASVCIAFWFERIENIVYVFPGIRSFARVPSSAYKGIGRIIFTYVIPATLVSTLPSQAIFGEKNYPLLLYLLIFGLISIKLSNIILNLGLKQYSSASS